MSAQAHSGVGRDAQPEPDERAQRMAALVRRLAERAQLQQEVERLARELEPEREDVPARGPGRVQALVARMFASRRRPATR